MEKLLEAVAAVACQFSPEKIRAIASRIRATEVSKAATELNSLVSTPAGSGSVERLVEAWGDTGVAADELASMLLAASHVYWKTAAEQKVELVWTGPTTPFVSTRRTEQALLQVINTASSALFLTSFVAYDVSSIVKALNVAGDRGVRISMLLESSQDHGGAISMDVIGKMKGLVPVAQLYAWQCKEEQFSDGRVHAKVAVADSRICFITSANLTGYAMERNMEAGVLITGGQIPASLASHLKSLVDTNIVAAV